MEKRSAFRRVSNVIRHIRRKAPADFRPYLLIVFKFLTQRVRGLAEAIDAFRAGDFTQPARLPAADPEGDEILKAMK